jgi:uncharacterized membrane protein YkoI
MRKRWVLAAAFAWGLAMLVAPEAWAEKGKKEEKVTLDQVPAAVKATLLKEAKDAKIEEIEKETKNGTTTYEAKFVADGKTVEVKVASDGTLLKRKVEDEEKVTLDQVPAAVKDTILKEAKGAKIEAIEKETKKGESVYEAEFLAEGKEVEIRVASDGKLLKEEAEDEDEDEENEEEGNVTLDQVPPAVKATLLKEANGAKITEIEKETKNGKTVYEAEFVAGGKTVEVKVASDGKLLKREVEDDEDEEEDEDEK